MKALQAPRYATNGSKFMKILLVYPHYPDTFWSFKHALKFISKKEGNKMSKKNKTIRVKLIANPGAGNASDAPDKLKLVTGYLKKNGLKVMWLSPNQKKKPRQLPNEP